jgi:hypothetical protein
MARSEESSLRTLGGRVSSTNVLHEQSESEAAALILDRIVGVGSKIPWLAVSLQIFWTFLPAVVPAAKNRSGTLEWLGSFFTLSNVIIFQMWTFLARLTSVCRKDLSRKC